MNFEIGIRTLLISSIKPTQNMRRAISRALKMKGANGNMIYVIVGCRQMQICSTELGPLI